MPHSKIGSVWGKWDLQFHTPSSYDYKDASVTNQRIIDVLVASDINAVAITDHHVLDAQRITDLQRLGGDKICVFPGIELRTQLGGKESVHLIGIFSEKADPVYLTTRIQGVLQLTPKDVAERGDEKIYVDFVQAASLIRELGGVVSVHAGKKSNSLENITNSEIFKRAVKTDLARDYIDLLEVGKVEDIQGYEERVFPEIGFSLPLVIGSDNHDIKAYKLKAPCWIKGDPVSSNKSVSRCRRRW